MHDCSITSSWADRNLYESFRVNQGKTVPFTRKLY